MKMYAAFDTDRQKYFRLVYDGKAPFTVKPDLLLGDKNKVNSIIREYSKDALWQHYGMKGKAPKLVLKMFQVKEVQP